MRVPRPPLPGCAAVHDDLTELALGILTGRERSEVLAHVEGCEPCAAELEELAATADLVLQLAPEAEPPVGFELRLIQRLHAGGTARRRIGPPRAVRSAVAALLALVVGFGTAWLAHAPTSSPSASSSAGLTSAALTSKGRSLGEVYLSAGKPAWLFMAIDSGADSELVRCEVTLADGKVVTVGWFHLSGGYGAWGAPLPGVSGQVRTARVLTERGTVLASARLVA